MKKRKVDLFFNYDIGEYKAGYAYTLEIDEVTEQRLLRRGCIYPSKDAKYYQGQKKPEEKVTKKDDEPVKEEIKDVDNKDIKQAKVQKRTTASGKSKK